MLATQVAYWSNVETRRHNLATESQENQRIAENRRHNLAQEDIGFRNINLGYANLSEQARHNRAYEVFQNASLAETTRANKERERLTDEANWTERSKSQETMRHNAATEQQEGQRVRNDTVGTATKSLGDIAKAVAGFIAIAG